MTTVTLQRATAARVFMDTLVAFEVLHEDADTESADRAINEAFGWFAEVERTCSRFDPASELRRLCERTDQPVRPSALLFAAIAFAVELAERTNGAFDPAVGARMEAAGFDTNYRTGERQPQRTPGGAMWRDIEVDREGGTVRLRRPLTIDLGAVAKGMAVDLAARAFAGFPGFVIDAGGDIFAGGTNADGGPWVIGLRDPSGEGTLAGRVAISDAAICTSGDYERRAADGHHILDPRGSGSATECIGVTVIAESAMAADALATAAFVLGPEDGIALLEEEGADGCLATSDGRTVTTRGFEAYLR
ncbi:MAG: FAD:protein FMN transferase [Dehalococcoidia bacterium]|nr:FAD:protein FMN transferase [Dehalococcoidia bacterium]